MNIKVIGSGGAFSSVFGNTQLGLIIDEKDPMKNVLFDCGITTIFNFSKQKLDLKTFGNIYITHAHDDHLGGLGTLALMHYFMFNRVLGCKPKLIAKAPLMKDISHFTLHGCKTLAAHQLPEGKKEATIDDYFERVVIGDNSCFALDDYELIPLQTTHVSNGYDLLYSYGLVVRNVKTNKKILITGDTQFCPSSLISFYEECDIIIHDCETSYDGWNENGQLINKNGFKSLVHSNYTDLLTLPKKIRSKMYLIHYSDFINEKHHKTALEHGFAGFLFPGDELNF